MPKDLKIGMLFGLLIVSAVAVWLCTRPALIVKSRMLQSGTKQAPAVLPSRANDVKVAVSQQTEKKKTRTYHIVQAGDTLSQISYKYYGSTEKWSKILSANQATLTDPNKLKPGTKLIIQE
jgi:nucleoid-associated protein YgaU